MIKLIDIQPKGLSISTPQAWRSWLNDITEWQHDLLHNHRPDGGEIYRFPLVQYHARGFRGLQAGTSLLLKILPLLEAEADLEISTLKHEIKMLPKAKIYNLNRWQPFNANNYTIWNEKRALAERVQLLESILVANILGFCREVGFEIPNKSLQVRLVDALEDLGFQRFSTLNAELYRKTFNIRFECNIDLPENIGLGRGSSKGFGRLYLENQKVKRAHKILL